MAAAYFYNSDNVSPNSMHEVDVPDYSQNAAGRVYAATSPLMGPSGWSAADLIPGYSSEDVVVNQATGNTLSAAYNPNSLGIYAAAVFSDGATSCDIAFLLDDGTGTFNTIATFTGKNALNAGGMNVGPWPTGVSLAGRAIKVQILNYSGAGQVSVKVQRLSN